MPRPARARAMRGILTLTLALLTLTLFAAATAQAATREVCVTIDGAKAVCAYPDEPAFLLCVDVKGNPVACVPDPCGTTSCW